MTVDGSFLVHMIVRWSYGTPKPGNAYNASATGRFLMLCGFTLTRTSRIFFLLECPIKKSCRWAYARVSMFLILTIGQYDINSGEITQEYDQHLGPVNTITFVDENRRFVTTSDDKTIRAWDFDIPVVIKYIAEPHMHSMPSVTLHPSSMLQFPFVPPAIWPGTD